MSAPEEIVCETVEMFRRAAWTRLGANVAEYGPGVQPGDSVTIGGKTVVYRPPPPRDEAREAFDLLYRDWVFTTEYHKKDIYNAFLAGRDSVKS